MSFKYVIKYISSLTNWYSLCNIKKQSIFILDELNYRRTLDG